MHKPDTYITVYLIFHWWSLEQTPPQVTHSPDSERFQGTELFPLQVLKSRWKEKARAIEMTTAKVPETTAVMLTYRKGREDHFKHELWTLPLGRYILVPKLLQPAKVSAPHTMLLTWTVCRGCIRMCWSNVESNSPSEWQLLSPVLGCQQMNQPYSEKVTANDGFMGKAEHKSCFIRVTL